MAARADRYIPRIVDHELDRLLTGLPAIALEGAKGVGKTATATRRASRVVRLDVDQERIAFAAAPFDLKPEGTLLIDEWQRFPESWDRVRRAVDGGAPAGSFLLTGSSAPRGTTVHSGAGRLVVRRLRPLSLAERGLGEPAVSLKGLIDGEQPRVDARTGVGLPDYVDEIFSSGFPAVRALPTDFRADALDGYLAHAVEREFAEQGAAVRRPATLRAWLRAYAAATATPASYTTILDAATAGVPEKPSRTTTTLYRDVLARSFLLDPVEAWTPAFNPLQRLAQSPKHYLADPALAARLLQLSPQAVLTGTDRPRPALGPGSLLGPLFEHLVAQSVLAYAQAAGAHVGHLRQRDGRHEVDLIVEKGRAVVAIEVKLAATVADDDVVHLAWLRHRLGGDLADAIVVTTGQLAYRRPDGIAVVPAALLGP